MNLRRVQRTRTVISLLLAIVLLLPTGISVASDTATPISPAPVLVSIRAAHHPGFDRVVFDFAGALPSRRDAHYVNRLVADPSGASIPMPSGAILKVTFHPAIAHTRAGRPTTARRIAFALPSVITVVRAGDFESVVSYGIGLAKKTSVHVSTASHPSRVVIDISTAAAAGSTVG